MNPSSIQYNQIFGPILIGLTLLIGAFFLRPLYTEYLNSEVQLTMIEQQKVDKQKSLDELIAMQQNFASSGITEISQKIQKLDQKFSASDIMETVMLNEFTKATTILQPRIEITSINVSEGNKLPNGLSLGLVNLALSALSVDDMIEYITYLTQSSRFAFTIDSISLPIDTTKANPLNTGVSLSLTLGIYYYE
jgi:hypothetical protein